jgi:hypothetical protein
LSVDEVDIRQRINTLVDSVKGDRARSQELFQYVWTMMCVRRGLLRVVREVRAHHGTQLVVEEVRSGRHHLVSRPHEIDSEIEGLAVQALARILGELPGPG